MEDAGVDSRAEGLDVDYEEGRYEDGAIEDGAIENQDQQELENGQPAPKVQQVRRSAIVRQFAGLIPTTKFGTKKSANDLPRDGLARGAIAGLAVSDEPLANDTLADETRIGSADAEETAQIEPSNPVKQATYEEPAASAVPHDQNALSARSASEFGAFRHFDLLVEAPGDGVPAVDSAESAQPLPSAPRAKGPLRLRR
jgi:hypothetical protein